METSIATPPTLSAELIRPDQLPDILDHKDVQALPFEDRSKVLEQGITEASDWVTQNGGWTPELYRGFGDSVNKLRGDMAATETIPEKFMSGARTAGEMGVGLGRTLEAAAFDLSPKTQTGQWRVPLSETAPLLNEGLNKASSAVDSWLDAARFGTEGKALEAELATLNDELAKGAFPMDHPDKLQDWFKKRSHVLSQKQRAYYASADQTAEPEEINAYANANGLEAPRNAALLAQYLRTRNTNDLKALRDNLIELPTHAKADEAQRQIIAKSDTAKRITAQFPDSSGVNGGTVGEEAMSAAGDPANALALMSGFSAGASTEEASLAAKLLKGAAHAQAWGALGLAIQKPGSRPEDYWDNAKHMFAGALGMQLAGLAVGGIRGALSSRAGAENAGAEPVSAQPDPLPATDGSGGSSLSRIAANAGREAPAATPATVETPTPASTEPPPQSQAPPAVQGDSPTSAASTAEAADTQARGFTNTAIPLIPRAGEIALPAESGRLLSTGTSAAPGDTSFVAYQGTGPFRVQRPDLRAILRGGLLPKELEQLLTTSNHEKAAVKQAAAQITNDLNQTITDYAKRTGQPLQHVYDWINTALEDPMIFGTILEPGLREATRRARNFLDDLSTTTASITGGQLGETILQNLGQWMRRSYAAFDPQSGWSLDALEKAASKDAKVAGKPAAQILGNARRYLQSQFPRQNAAEIKAIMKDLTNRNTWGAVLGGDATSLTADVGSLMHRKEIAPEVRALMGEETNPIKRIASSATFQAQFIARHQMQRNMRRVGLAMGLFSETKQGEYNVQVGGDAGPLNKRWAGFGELYTTEEMWNALQNSKGVVEGTDLGGWFIKTIKFLNGEAKMNKVALNPDSWSVNILGNLTGLVASGDTLSVSGWKNMWHAVEMLWSGRKQKGEVMGTAMGLLQDENRQMMARLRASGVASGGLEMQDVEAHLDNRVLQFIKQSEARDYTEGAARGAIMGQALGAPFGFTGRMVGGAVGSVAGVVAGGNRIVNAQKFIAEWTMSKPDNWGKIAVFHTNYETHLAAGMPEPQAYELAVEKTLNTMPDYAKLKPLFRSMSHLGILGSFIAFQHEVYRNTYWNARYAFQELRSGNPALMQRGAARFFGLALILGTGGWVGMSALGFDRGTTDKKDEAYRRSLARPWDRFSSLVYDKLDAHGASYFNTSYLIPQATIFELIRAAREGRTLDEALSNVAAQVKDQFANGSVHVQPVIEALTNQRSFGGKVTPETGLAGLSDRVLHVVSSTLTPGFAEKAERIERAALGRSRGERTFSIEEEMKRLLGIRQATYTHEQRMADRLYGFADRLRDAHDIARRAWNDNGRNNPDTIGRMEQENALTRANEQIAKVAADFQEWKRDLGLFGISDQRINAVEHDRRVYVRPKALHITKDGPAAVK